MRPAYRDLENQAWHACNSTTGWSQGSESQLADAIADRSERSGEEYPSDPGETRQIDGVGGRNASSSK